MTYLYYSSCHSFFLVFQLTNAAVFNSQILKISVGGRYNICFLSGSVKAHSFYLKLQLNFLAFSVFRYYTCWVEVTFRYIFSSQYIISFWYMESEFPDQFKCLRSLVSIYIFINVYFLNVFSCYFTLAHYSRRNPSSISSLNIFF